MCVSVCLKIILPPDYPSSAPPIYQINAGWLRGADRTTLSNSLEELYVENTGESILYLWVEKIREFLAEKSQSEDGPEMGKTVTTEEEAHDYDEDDLPDYSMLKLANQSAQLLSSASDGSTVRIKTLSCRTARTTEKPQRGADCSISCRSWTCVTCWWWSLGGTAGSCWAPTASNTSTTAPGTSSFRRVTPTLQRKHPKLEARIKDLRARRQNKKTFLEQMRPGMKTDLRLRMLKDSDK
ncbi:protein IMPACT isoform X2 [Sinocyclocheilus anshuiensis]|uniref:protein IMPACT isoform X2 n=1 Tax=Sinocyclocheilus anshuiensis TaxID=1608454 RepID=UPI0007B89F8C|nr:PREDICTED: protein IMPACT isoform X2 [Sinocyclocheilus anshuiensis]